MNINELYDAINNGEEVRKNLIEIKKLLKDNKEKIALLYRLGDDYTTFINLLDDEDAKVRKNAALIMGELGEQDLLEHLYSAYESEEKLFVKSSYLNAMAKYDYRDYLKKMNVRLKELLSIEPAEGDAKHINEEIRTLQQMLIKYDTRAMHTFTDLKKEHSVVLTVNRENAQMIKNSIDRRYKPMADEDKIYITADNIENVKDIRTYNEILFPLQCSPEIEEDAQLMAEEIGKSDIIELLDEMHSGEGAYYFRVEFQSSMPLEKKSTFVKNLAAGIEKATGRRLINTPSDYEIEIRFADNHNRTYTPYLRLYTVKDDRFDYRQRTVATSLNPVTAALCVSLVKNYMMPEANVLDPFAGVGTMLIERAREVKARGMYAIDTFDKAVIGGRVNAQLARTYINFINRDFFDFKHEYKFDEIFTQMPAKSKNMSDDDYEQLYKKFFEKSWEVMSDDSVIIVYSEEKPLIKKYVRINGNFKLVREFPLMEKRGVYLFVIKKIS